MSENRRTRRYLELRAKKGKLGKKDLGQTYADNKGIEYDYKWIAKISSFYNIVMGCFKNGFPIFVPKLWYIAWAFYPFFFIRKDLRVEDPIPILNHERIHVRQQRDIHLCVSLPLLILCAIAEFLGWFNPLWLICLTPFIPTIFYGIEMLRSWQNLCDNNKDIYGTKEWDEVITFKNIRENTCFEREAISRATNADYLFERKFMAVLAYTGIKCFSNYGMK